MTAIGLKRIQSRLRQQHRLMGVGVEQGLKRAALLLQRASQKLVPVDMGVLRASAYARKISGSGHSTVVAVGYTASYAGFVHENMDLAHGKLYNIKYARQIKNRERYWRSDLRRWVVYRSRGDTQQAHFLINALAHNFKLVLSTVNTAVVRAANLR